MKMTTRKLICIVLALMVSIGMLMFASFAASTSEAPAEDEGETMVLFSESETGAAEEGEDAVLLAAAPDDEAENEAVEDTALVMTVGAIEEDAEAEAEEDEAPASKFYGTFLALLPPIIAIVLALITKEVYSSLFIGIVAGALLYTNFNIVGTLESIFSVMTEYVGDAWNLGILIFLVILGIIVGLVT